MQERLTLLKLYSIKLLLKLLFEIVWYGDGKIVWYQGEYML